MNHSGFSLVELSIVLVILGLLTGGILGGQSLMHAAELRKVTLDIDRYKTAILSFRDKYLGLPGDITNATRFWGEADADPTTCITTAGTGSETCNGDGDGNISRGAESYRSWQQLANANLLPGTFSGVPGPSPWGSNYFADEIGTNIPSIYNERTGIVISKDWNKSHFWYQNHPTGHVITIATCCNGVQKNIEGNGVVPEDAWHIDQKLDDGKADSGKVQIYRGYWPNCTTANTSPANYVLSESTAECQMLIDAGF